MRNEEASRDKEILFMYDLKKKLNSYACALCRCSKNYFRASLTNFSRSCLDFIAVNNGKRFSIFFVCSFFFAVSAPALASLCAGISFSPLARKCVKIDWNRKIFCCSYSQPRQMATARRKMKKAKSMLHRMLFKCMFCGVETVALKWS